ncbi:MAG: adenylyltransferase/cytidyltransferase family protein [Luteolibacter sp.]
MLIDDPSNRVMGLPGCIELREDACTRGKRVVLTNGCFDLLHRGHLEYLRKSAELGDLLVVAINSDESVRTLKGASRPLNSEADRAYALACLRFVDAVFIFQGPRLANEILALGPDLYTKAGDYSPETLDRSEYAALVQAGTEIHILPFVAGHSTTSLIARGAVGSGQS